MSITTRHNIFLSNTTKTSYYLGDFFFFDGKSYKVSMKQSILNLRFNRVNRTVFCGSNISFINKNGIKKIYINNSRLSRTTLKRILVQARNVNTYTLRGLWSTSTPITKRAGRVSEYM